MATVLFYREKDGLSQIEDFMTRLAEKAEKNKSDRIRLEAIRFCIAMLKEKGLKIREPYAKKIEGQTNLYELRPHEDCVFLFSCMEETIVLLHSFIKKSPKTPLKEIVRAAREREEYIKRRMKKGKNRFLRTDSWDELEEKLYPLKERQNMKNCVRIVDTIQDAREKKHLSLRQLAEISGVSHPIISRFENGITDPRLSTIVTLLSALGLELSVQPIQTQAAAPAKSELSDNPTRD